MILRNCLFVRLLDYLVAPQTVNAVPIQRCAGLCIGKHRQSAAAAIFVAHSGVYFQLQRLRQSREDDGSGHDTSADNTHEVAVTYSF